MAADLVRHHTAVIATPLSTQAANPRRRQSKISPLEPQTASRRHLELEQLRAVLGACQFFADPLAGLSTSSAVTHSEMMGDLQISLIAGPNMR
jgi:hypothetical protein